MAPDTHIIIIDPAASWLSDNLRGQKKLRHRFSFTAGERRIFRKKKKIPVSRWAEKHRVVTMSALPGPWRNEITPYLSGIMDASFHSAVQTVIVCKAPQVGCTEAILNCIGYAADRDPGPVLAVYPDEKTARENSQDRIQPMFEASPRLRSLLTGTEDDKAVLRIKLNHMIMYMAWATSASRLANKPIRYAVLDELDKYPKTAGKREAAPEALAETRTTTYRWNRKIWKISSTTIETAPIWRALTQEAQVIFDYWVRCPLCGEMQLMRFSRETFRWPREIRDQGSGAGDQGSGAGDQGSGAGGQVPGAGGQVSGAGDQGSEGTVPEFSASSGKTGTVPAQSEIHSMDPEKIEAEGLAWYECEHCRGHWNDTLRDQAVRAGQWRERLQGSGVRDQGSEVRGQESAEGTVPEFSALPGKTGTVPGKEAGPAAMELFDYLDAHRPRKIGFHIPSWISYFVSLSEVAAAFLKGQRILEDFKNFKNKHEAVPWKQIVVSADEGYILKACCDLPAQTVPQEARALMCGIDVQKYGFWFVVRAFVPDFTSWLIHYGFLGTWGDVEQLLFETEYPAAEGGKKMRIARACIDTGGGQKYQGMSMTEETYWWLRDNSAGRGARVWGTKGSSRALAGKLQLGKPLDKTPSGKPLPGGLRIISVDTEKMKDAYHYHLNRAIEGLPQGAYLHAETGADYADQILAEEKQITEKGIEEWVQIRAANHLFDCECLAMLCADPEFPGGGINLLRPPVAGGAPTGGGRRIISKGI
ncbi:hypothetical protein ES708_01012 [subsurface metagenome]